MSSRRSDCALLRTQTAREYQHTKQHCSPCLCIERRDWRSQHSWNIHIYLLFTVYFIHTSQTDVTSDGIPNTTEAGACPIQYRMPGKTSAALRIPTKYSWHMGAHFAREGGLHRSPRKRRINLYSLFTSTLPTMRTKGSLYVAYITFMRCWRSSSATLVVDTRWQRFP